MPTSCGKVSYSNPVAAWRALRTLCSHTARFTHKRIHRRCRPYRCEDCHCWHLTRRLPLKRPNRWRDFADPVHHSSYRRAIQPLTLDVEAVR